MNHKPGSRWFGKPCIRPQVKAHIQRPLRDHHGPCNIELPVSCLETRNSLPQAGVSSSWGPGLRQYQTMNDSYVQHRHQYSVRSFLGVLKPYSQLIRIAQSPLPNGMVLSWMNAQPYMQVEFGAPVQSKSLKKK